MALPTLADLKLVLRVQSTVEDGLLTQVLARASAIVETAIGYPLTIGRTFARAGGGWRVLSSLRHEPAAAGVAVTSRVTRTTSALADHPDYATRLEPLVSQAILDVAADLYTHREPDVQSVSDGGASKDYSGDGIPPRAARIIQQLRAELG